MNISILNTFDNKGGAAITTYEHLSALLSYGVNAKMIVSKKTLNDENILEYSNSTESKDDTKLYRWLFNRLNSENEPKNQSYFSFPYYPHVGKDLCYQDIIIQSSIIELHWIARFLSIEDIYQLIATGKKIVWSLHDMSAFTGGCHYSLGCEGYKDSCYNCCQAKPEASKLPAVVLNRKASLFSNGITVVTQSRWLAKLASSSTVFRNSRIETIAPGIDTNLFFPKMKSEIRASYGIGQKDKVILFGSENVNNKRKGFKYLVDVILGIDKNFSIYDKKLHFFSIGHSMDLPVTRNRLVNFGFVENKKDLSDIYNSADLFLLTSTEDNFPRTLRESLACGVPVVAFNTGGVSDLLIDEKNGFLIDGFDTETYIKKCLYLLENESLYNRCSSFARSQMKKNFNLDVSTRKYIELYSELLGKKV